MLKELFRKLLFVTALILLVSAGGSGVLLADEILLPEIDGVYGMEGSDAEAWLAVKVPIPDGSALAGFLWYNNDGQSVFPQVMAGTGYLNSPGPIVDFTELAVGVLGSSSEWCELEFSQPIAAGLGSLYMAFKFPEGQELTARGQGGGPAIGYMQAAEGYPGWLSGEGEIWGKLHSDYGFAIHPMLVPFEDGMAVKSLGDVEKEEPEPVREVYLQPGPNPFNPRTDIKFGLLQGGHVQVDIYDIRGHRVVCLLDEDLVAGHHNVVWQGQDSSGRSTASGVYFIRLRSPGIDMKQKVMMVR